MDFIARMITVSGAILKPKMTVGGAYTIWFFIGLLGFHRIYCDRILSGFAMMASWTAAIVLMLTSSRHPGSWYGLIGLFVVLVQGLWWLFDAILIRDWVIDYHRRLQERIATQRGAAGN